MERVPTMFFLSLLIALQIAASGEAEQLLYARYPALSPDGSLVAFCHRGDIWLVSSEGGEAARLTVHEAEEIRPHFSPDGQWLLFSSNRFNNYDIYVIPVSGGTARRLTFDTADDLASGWLPTGDSVLFVSARDGRGDLFKVSIEGGMPIKLTGDYYEREFDGKASHDGRYIAFTTGSGLVRWWRRDLKTAGNSDIYLLDRAQPSFKTIRLTNHPTHEIWPVVDSRRGQVYYVANYDDSWAQVHRIPMQGGEPTKLTNFTDDGVQWLNGTPDGSLLVFEQNFRLWTLDPSEGTPREVPITVRSDERVNLVVRETFTNKVQWYSLSPDDKKIAAVIHGEIFLLPAEKPVEGIRATYTSARENYPEWDKDSRRIYYQSNRDGVYQIYSYDVVSGKETRLTSSTEPDVKPLPSPDRKYLAFFRGLDKIMRLDLTSGKETVWVEGNFFDLGIDETREFDWSPDSRWLAFTMAGPTYETDIYVVELDGKPENISRFVDWNSRPRFSRDGTKVYFTSANRWGAKTMQIDLVQKPLEFFESAFDSLFAESPKSAEKGDKKATSGESVEKTQPVRIDFDRIERRRAKAFELHARSTHPVMTPDGKKYLFVAPVLGKPEIWSVETGEEPGLKQLSQSGKEKSFLRVTSDSKSLYYLEGGQIRKLSISDGKSEAVSFSAVLDVDQAALSHQKFAEGWRMLNQYFYDPEFRGVDWRDARRKYEGLMAQIRTGSEFRDVMLEMMGELRGSHVDYYYDSPSTDKNLLTGQLGLEVDYRELERTGNFRVADVIRESPADIAGVQPGEYIVSINANALTRETNISELLNGTVGRRVTLSVVPQPKGTLRDLHVKPINSSQLANLRYEDWVERNRKVVDSLSNGRLAYLHIRSMNQTALERFEQEIVSIAEPKEALLIDVRENSGGWIAVHLLTILQRQPFMLRSFRNFPLASENKSRAKAWEKPSALLINNYSGSNAEIFAEGFRKLELGPIIGTPTGGGVIGTSEYKLIDGSGIRRPSWGAYTLEMEDTDLTPRQPDIFVENLPDDLMVGRDPQLVRAIRELLDILD